MSLTKIPLGMVDISELSGASGDVAVYNTIIDQIQISKPFL